ncbi:transcription regulator [Paenibacillus sp. JCM 10914]|nr:transcription regulator [Paenibacillus sp. JCM 10914]
MNANTPLQGKVAVVAGSTRGAGRAIAVALGAAGATVYCTGRSTRRQASDLQRSETIEDTADMVTERGGIGIAVQCDHTSEAQVKALFQQVREEQDGRLDILVNDIWGGEGLTHWNVPFWKQPLSDGLLMQQRAVSTHMITSHYGVPLMAERGQGLIIEVTDGASYRYRGNLYYSLAKISNIHLAEAWRPSCPHTTSRRCP